MKASWTFTESKADFLIADFSNIEKDKVILERCNSILKMSEEHAGEVQKAKLISLEDFLTLAFI